MRPAALLVALVTACVVAVLASGAPASHTRGAVAPTFTLVASPTCPANRARVGRGCVDRTSQGDWTVADGNSKWDVPGQWLATYTWTIPTTVPAAGAPLKLSLSATERVGGPNNRVCPAIGSFSNFAFKGGLGQPYILGVCASAGQTVSDSKTITLVPSSAAAPGSIYYLNVGLQSGPTFTYTYKGGAAPTGCRPSGSASTASRAGGAASGRVTFSFNHTGVPKRGESPTLVTSATGGSGSFSICGDPAKKWVTGTLAKGTVIHLDGHAHLGRTVNDRLTLKVVGARVRVYGGPVGRVAADLFVKVTASNDSLCKVGRLGSIELVEAAASGGGDSQVTVNLCGRDHDHAFTHFDFGLRKPVRVAVQITIPK